MRLRRTRRAGAVALAVALAIGAVVHAGRGAEAGADSGDGRPATGRVLVVSVPDLTWGDVQEASTPAIRSLAGESSVALLSTRTADDVDTAASAYLTLGAGRRAGSVPGDAAGEAVEDPAGVVVPTFEELVRRNEELRYGAEPGALGSALAAAGRSVVVVGDAAAEPADRSGRSVALSTADGSGRTPLGRVEGLLQSDPAAPGGAWLDQAAVLEVVASQWDDGGLAVVEASDLRRALRAVPPGSDPDTLRLEGLRRTDELVGALVELADPALDTVVLVAPTAPDDDRQPGVFAWSGPGVDAGLARSASTRRSGYVALSDVASTVLQVLGVPVPPEVSDTPIGPDVGDPGESASDRISDLAAAGVRAVERDRTVGPLAVTVVLLAILCGLLGLASIRWASLRRPWVRWCCASAASIPAVSFTVGWWPGVGVGPGPVVVWVLVLAAAVGAAALAAGRRFGTDWTPVVPVALTVALIVLDVLLGARLQLDTPLGYSASVAGRFAGLGNQASAYLLTGALAVVASSWPELSARGVGDRALAALASGLGATVVLVTGAPWWGADVGGVLAALPAFAVVVLLARHRGRAGPRALVAAALALAAAAVALVVVAVWDRSRPVSAQTHLGRFLEDVLNGTGSSVLERKLAASWDVFASTPWTVAVPVLLVGLASLAWVPGRGQWEVARPRPALGTFGGAAAVAGLLGWALNDSGVAVPAAMLAVAVPYVACVLTLDGAADDASRAPATDTDDDALATVSP